MTELARRVVHEIQKDDCLGRAAQLAYYFLFALFPFFLVLITLLGYLPLPNLMDRLMDMLAQMLPGDALSLVQNHVRELISGTRGTKVQLKVIPAGKIEPVVYEAHPTGADDHLSRDEKGRELGDDSIKRRAALQQVVLVGSVRGTLAVGVVLVEPDRAPQ